VTVLRGQLTFDLDPAGTDDLADLDMERAGRQLEAEAAEAPPPPACRCVRRSGAITEDGMFRCLKCGRSW
jgi:hypothetical protein